MLFSTFGLDFLALEKSDVSTKYSKNNAQAQFPVRDQVFVPSHFTIVSLDFVSFVWKINKLLQRWKHCMIFDTFKTYQAFRRDSNHKNTNLFGMFKVDNKNTRKRCETCLQLKLRNKYTRTALSNSVLLSSLLTLKVLLTWFQCFCC